MIYYIFAGDDYYPSGGGSDLKSGFEAEDDLEALKTYYEWESRIRNSVLRLNNRDSFEWICLRRGDKSLSMVHRGKGKELGEL